MGQAEQSIQHTCDPTELKQVREWEIYQVEFRPYYETLLIKAGTVVDDQPEKPKQKYR